MVPGHIRPLPGFHILSPNFSPTSEKWRVETGWNVTYTEHVGGGFTMFLPDSMGRLTSSSPAWWPSPARPPWPPRELWERTSSWRPRGSRPCPRPCSGGIPCDHPEKLGPPSLGPMSLWWFHQGSVEKMWRLLKFFGDDWGMVYGIVLTRSILKILPSKDWHILIVGILCVSFSSRFMGMMLEITSNKKMVFHKLKTIMGFWHIQPVE